MPIYRLKQSGPFSAFHLTSDLTAKEGDWLALRDGEFVVFTDKEFGLAYEPIEESLYKGITDLSDAIEGRRTSRRLIDQNPDADHPIKLNAPDGELTTPTTPPRSNKVKKSTKKSSRLKKGSNLGKPTIDANVRR